MTPINCLLAGNIFHCCYCSFSVPRRHQNAEFCMESFKKFPGSRSPDPAAGGEPLLHPPQRILRPCMGQSPRLQCPLPKPDAPSFILGRLPSQGEPIAQCKSDGSKLTSFLDKRGFYSRCAFKNIGSPDSCLVVGMTYLPQFNATCVPPTYGRNYISASVEYGARAPI
jgi:hypothetical protein